MSFVGAGRLLAAAIACALLGACAQPMPVAIVAGQVDPERIRAPKSAANGQACAIRKRASLPVSVTGLPMVSAQINGRPATLILDTGAEHLILTASAASRLSVTTKYDFERSMAGIGKAIRTGDARLDSMRLGGIALPYPRALVGDFALRVGGAEPDGLLGASALADFDLDIDLPHRRLDLYDRLDCATLRPPWSGRYVSLETTRSLSLHPFVPVTINGQRMTASLDSGAQRTVIASRAATRVGIDAKTQLAGPEMRTQGVAGEMLPATVHQFRDFQVGGVPVRGPVLVVPAALPRDIDALLGFDFLLANRVWLSYGSRRIFIQPE